MYLVTVHNDKTSELTDIIVLSDKELILTIQYVIENDNLNIVGITNPTRNRVVNGLPNFIEEFVK